MPFTAYDEGKILDQVFGGTAWSPPATLYAALLLQEATIATSGLTQGTAYTSITTTALAFAVATGDQIAIGTGASRQIVTASAPASAAATSISVNSFVATSTWAVGTSLTLLKSTAEVTGSGYGRIAVTNNATNFPAATGSNPATKTNGTAINFAALSGNISTCSGWAFFDALTTGNMIFADVLTLAQAFSTNNAPSIPASSMTITDL